jgi:hypothetical protein
MMPGVEPRCIEKRDVSENLSRLAVFERNSIKLLTVQPDRFERAAVNEPVTTGQLHGVNVATGQLRGLGLGFSGRFVQVVEGKPLTPAAEIIRDAVVCALRVTVTIDLHDRGPSFNGDREPGSGLCGYVHICILSSVFVS